jgi:hypothetical protein
MKISYPYGASDEIFAPHTLDFSLKPVKAFRAVEEN